MGQSFRRLVLALGQVMHVVLRAPAPTWSQKVSATFAKESATMLEPGSDGEQPVYETVRSVRKHR
jgi:hypothetical protein